MASISVSWDSFSIHGTYMTGGATAYVAGRSGSQVKIHVDYWMDHKNSTRSTEAYWVGYNQYSGMTTIHEGGSEHSGRASASVEFWVDVGYASGYVSLILKLGAHWGSSDPTYSPYKSIALPYDSNYEAPSAPTIGTTTKVSDEKARVAFSASASAQRPLSRIILLRATDDSGYVQIDSIPWGGQTSFEDSTISANHKYAYRIIAENPAGLSPTSSASNAIYTTPAAPSGLAAVYDSGGASTTESWTNNATHPASYEVQAADNDSFDGASTYTASASHYTDAAPPTGTAWYRVRAIDVAGNASAWTPGVSVAVLAAPSAPTLNSPSQSAVFAMPSTVRIGWVHNAVDGTAQSAAVVAVSADGGGTWTEHAVSGSAASYSLDTSSMSRDTVLSVKVKTKGAHADYGPYCSTVSFSLREAPSVSITFPATDGSEVTVYPVNTSWSIVCRSGSIVDTVWELSGVSHSLGAATSYSLAASELLLANREEYVLRVTVRSSYGLTATAERRFVTNYTEPAPARISISYDADAGSATVVVESDDCCMHECDGTEVAGSFSSFTFGGSTRYFIMPETSAGDILWWSGAASALYLVDSAAKGFYTDVEVDYDTFAAVYIGNALVVSNIVASFDGDELVMDPAVASFSGDRLSITDATAVSFSAMPSPDHFILYRVSDDGEELLSDSLAAGGSVIDRVPPLNAEYAYKACSITSSGMASISEKAAYADNPDGWFMWNYGTSFDDIACMRFDTDDREDLQNNSESVLFEGDDFPTAFGGSANTGDLSISGVVIGDEQRLAFHRGLAGWKGRRAIYRTPYGFVAPVRVHSVSVRRTAVPSAWDVSIGQEHVL